MKIPFLKTESYKKGAVLSTALNIFARGFAFLNTLLIAYYFGSNVSTDVYFFVIGLVLLIGTTINGIDYLILIPETMKLRMQRSEPDAERFINFFIYVYLLIGLLLAGSILISPISFFAIFSKFDVLALEANYKLLFLGSVLIVLHLVTNLISALLASFKYFTAPLLSGLINSLFAIIFTVIFYNTWGIIGTMYGIVLGYAINLALLIFTLKRYQHWNFWNVGWMGDLTAWSNIGLIQVNILPVWLRNYVTLYLLSGLDMGIITAVTIAQQLAGVIDVFISNQILSVVGIKLNEFSSKNDLKQAADLFLLATNGLLLLILPVVFIGVFYTHEILAVLFTFTSFGEAAEANIELCLKFLIILAPLNMINSLCTRFFAAFQKIKQTIVFSVISHIIFLILTVVLITGFQLRGYLYSQIAGYSLLMVLFHVLIRREFPSINTGKFVSFAVLQIVLNLVTAIIFLKLNEFVFYASGTVLIFAATGFQFLFVIISNHRNPVLKIFIDQLYVFSNKTGRKKDSDSSRL